MALMASPLNLPTSISKMATLADDIWYLAGDQSNDVFWIITLILYYENNNII